MKRFEFDLQQMKKIKINDYCEYPHQLNMYKYCTQKLKDQLSQ